MGSIPITRSKTLRSTDSGNGAEGRQRGLPLFHYSKHGAMAKLIGSPALIAAEGNKPKVIEEFIGRVNSSTAAISLARMFSPPGWQERGQTPEFDEYTLVLKGALRVESAGETVDVGAGQAVLAQKGDWVRYSSPGPEGAEYIAVCLPAFSPDTVHRDK